MNTVKDLIEYSFKLKKRQSTSQRNILASAAPILDVDYTKFTVDDAREFRENPPYQREHSEGTLRDDEGREIKTDAATASSAAMRLILAAAAVNSWDIFSLDVETAFLQGESYKFTEIYIRTPTGEVKKLKKSLCGLCDAPRMWMDSIHKTFRILGLRQSIGDPSLWIFREHQIVGKGI